MLDDKDGFVTPEEQAADMELSMFRAYVEDILNGHVLFISSCSKHEWLKSQLKRYASRFDKALNALVWEA